MNTSRTKNSLVCPSKSDFKTYQVNCLDTNTVLHKDISLQELNDLGFEVTEEEKCFYKNYVIICHTDNAAYDKAMSAYQDSPDQHWLIPKLKRLYMISGVCALIAVCGMMGAGVLLIIITKFGLDSITPVEVQHKTELMELNHELQVNAPTLPDNLGYIFIGSDIGYTEKENGSVLHFVGNTNTQKECENVYTGLHLEGEKVMASIESGTMGLITKENFEQCLNSQLPVIYNTIQADIVERKNQLLSVQNNRQSWQ